MKPNPGYYDYWPYENRPKIIWPGGAKVAFWIAPNIEFYELDPPANAQRKAWPTPQPSVPGYSIRDYGNRVGHERQMQVLDRYGVRGSISLSTALCEHHPEIIEACKARHWEFFSHGIYNTRYTYGMTPEQEREMIRDSIETIYRHTGQQCSGYLAPALSHSDDTLDIFSEVAADIFGADSQAGLYTCDLFHDDQPTPIKLRSGRRFISMPYSLEMNDTIVYTVNKVTPRHYLTMLKRHFDRLYAHITIKSVVLTAWLPSKRRWPTSPVTRMFGSVLGAKSPNIIWPITMTKRSKIFRKGVALTQPENW